MSCWSFAIVNGKLAELHFDKMKDKSIRLYGHCYVKASEYKTKQEKKYIAEDIKKMRFSWRKKKYKSVDIFPIRYTTGCFKEFMRS